MTRRSLFRALIGAPLAAKIHGRKGIRRPSLTVNKMPEFMAQAAMRFRESNRREQERRTELLADQKFMAGEKWGKV